MRKTTQLKNMLKSNKLEFLMEAHNGLSAKIVEEAGFKGIWGSGLSISAAMGVRDSNEASYTQVLEVCEFMVRHARALPEGFALTSEFVAPIVGEHDHPHSA